MSQAARKFMLLGESSDMGMCGYMPGPAIVLVLAVEVPRPSSCC